MKTSDKCSVSLKPSGVVQARLTLKLRSMEMPVFHISLQRTKKISEFNGPVPVYNVTKMSTLQGFITK